MFDPVFLERKTDWRAFVSDFVFMAVLRVFDSFGRMVFEMEFSTEQGAVDYLLTEFPGEWNSEVTHE